MVRFAEPEEGTLETPDESRSRFSFADEPTPRSVVPLPSDRQESRFSMAEPAPGTTLPPDETETPGFWDNFSSGLGFDSSDKSGFQKFQDLVLEDSFVGRAGASMLRTAVGSLTEAGSRMVQEEQNAKKFEEWQPQIWAAQDKVNGIQDRKSPAYQAAVEDLDILRTNFNLDLKGLYVKPEDTAADFDWGEVWDTASENKGVMIGAIARGLIADPELLAVPGGWAKTGKLALNAAQKLSLAGRMGKIVQQASKLGGEIVGAGGLGAGLGASAEIIHQFDDDPEAALDFDRVKDMAMFGTVGGVLPVGAAGLRATREGIRKVGEVFTKKGVDNIQAKAIQIYADNIDVDGIARLNKKAALDQAVAGAGLDDPAEAAFRDIMPDVEDFIDEDIAQLTAAKAAHIESQGGLLARAVRKAQGASDEIYDFWNDITQPITTRLRNMGLPHLAGRVNEHDLITGTQLGARQAVREQYGLAAAKLPKEMQELAKLHVLNGSFASVRNRFPREFQEQFDNVRKMLDDELIDMNDVGIDIGGVDDFFPRQFDYAGFAKSEGISIGKSNDLLAKAINSKMNLQGANKLTQKDIGKFPELIGKHLNEQEIAQAVARGVAKPGSTVGISPVTSSLKARTVDQIKPDMLQWYSDPAASLNDHVNRMTIRINDRRFFGGKAINEVTEGQFQAKVDDATMMRGFIDDHAARMVAKGEITTNEMDEVIRLLNARFVGGKDQPHSLLVGAKNIMYSATLGNPIAASTQLGDLGGAAYLNGIDDGVKGIVRSFGRNVDGFKIEDFGLQALVEPVSAGKTQKILDWSLRLGGFKAMDKLGKESVMNSTWGKLQKIAKKPPAQARAEIKARYGARLGEQEVESIYKGILTGDTTNPHVRLAVFSDLTKIQPISMSEMPVAYLNNPNMRIFFMLKTFTLKQIDLMRQDVLKEIGDGVRANNKTKVRDGILNMGKLLGTIGAANMGINASKQWMMGKDVELGDTIVNGILRNYGLSNYTLKQLQKGEPFSAAADLISPAVGVFENPLKEAMHTVSGGKWGMDTKGRWVDSLPYGRFVRFGQQFAEERL